MRSHGVHWPKDGGRRVGCALMRRGAVREAFGLARRAAPGGGPTRSAGPGAWRRPDAACGAGAMAAAQPCRHGPGASGETARGCAPALRGRRKKGCT